MFPRSQALPCTAVKAGWGPCNKARRKQLCRNRNL